LGDFRLDCDGQSELLFCDNDTNPRRLYGQSDVAGYCKDGINDCIVNGHRDAVNPARTGTKAAAHYALDVPAGGSTTMRLRLRPHNASRSSENKPAFADFDALFAARVSEADAFYAEIQHGIDDADAASSNARLSPA